MTRTRPPDGFSASRHQRVSRDWALAALDDGPGSRQLLLGALRALQTGDLESLPPTSAPGVMGEVRRTVEHIVGQQQAFAAELRRLRDRVVGGAIDRPFPTLTARGMWEQSARDVNEIVATLASPVLGVPRAMAEVDADPTVVMSRESTAGDERGRQAGVTGFLTHMAHELRSPLSSLMVLSRILAENREGTLSPRQLEFARMIHSAGADLVSLINDITDVSRIESGTIAAHVCEVELAELADYVELTFREVATQRGLEFRIELDAQLSPRMITDVQRLQQLLKNLLSNAFKFTERGHVLLRIHAAPINQAPRRPQPGAGMAPPMIAFSVSDTGVGIPEDRQLAIFEAFRQPDGTPSRSFGGIGLGLTISRGLARLLGGRLVLDSRHGEGSTFTFYCPAHWAAQGQPAPARSQLQPIAPEPPRAEAGRRPQPFMSAPARISTELSGLAVLVIGDDAHNIFGLTSTLEDQGALVVVAERAQAPGRLVRDTQVNAVVVDIATSDGGGCEVIRQIRSDERWSQLPLIVICAQALPSEQQRCMDAGASDFVPRPLDVERLVNLLKPARPGRVAASQSADTV